jgi:CBS domain-containing protein
MIPLELVPVLAADDEVVDTVSTLSDGVGRALVLEDGRLIGLLSITDVARALEVGRSGRPAPHG